MKTARDCLSTRVVTVSPEQRLNDVVAAIVKHDALYCAVVDRTGHFIGLVRLKDIVTRSPDRIFSDLVPCVLPDDIEESVAVDEVIKLLRTEAIDELVVLSPRRIYVGLVTRESLFTWWTQEARGQQC